MTIKQQGGIFGRNPTFNEVDVQTNVSFSDNAKALFGNSSDLAVYHNGSNSIIEDTGSGNLYIQGTHVYIKDASGNNFARFYDNGTGGQIRLYHDASKVFETNSSGISITGNVAVTSGNGIDFSATSGTGTSELFDDYEEGTFTPIYEASSSNPTVTYDIQAGHYTKIGNVCHCIIRIRTDAVSGGSGNLRLAGLPFAAKSAASTAMSGGITVNRADSFTTDTPANGLITGGAQYIEFYTDAAWGTQVTTSNLTNSANSNQLILSVVYQTA
jgi:hypothetical protein